MLADQSGSDKTQLPAATADGQAPGPIRINTYKPARTIVPNLTKYSQPVQYPSNKTITARYTWYNFLPLAIFVQFTKVGNIFWTIVCICNFIPSIAVNSPYMVLIVLSIIVILGVIKEGVTDWQRHKVDKLTNSIETVKVFSEKGAVKQKKTIQSEVKVGDILELSHGQVVPADCVVLKVVGDGTQSACYIQTAQLDGERNLKVKLPVNDIQKLTDQILSGEQSVSVTTSEPIANMYFFQGSIQTQGISEQQLSLQNFIPRGCEVKNSQVQVIVVATGPDTKIVLNQGKYSYKISNFEKQMNMIFITQILMLILFDCWFTYLNYQHISANLDQPLNHDVTEQNVNQVVSLGFVTYFLILMRLVPLDVIVATELGKVFISFLIRKDAEMMMIDPVPGSNQLVGCVVHSMQLPEELGCIDHIFSDKTGTLTKNELVLRRLSFAGRKAQGETIKQIENELDDLCTQTEQIRDQADLFLKCINVCHDVIPMVIDDNKVLSGSSQDELVLLEFSAQTQNFYTLFKRDNSSITLKKNNQKIYDVREAYLEYQLLKVFEFDSDRKMMTVVVKEESSGKIIVFTKGADSSVVPLCTNSKGKDGEGDKVTIDHLNEFAAQGYRTLAFGYKELNPSEIDLDSIKDAQPGEFEQNLTLLGVTAVEDLLQDNVTKCVSEMREAGCQVWILTGDKDATAKEIGIMCGVLSPERKLVEISDAKKFLTNSGDIGWGPEDDVLISGLAIEAILAGATKKSKKDSIIQSLLNTRGLIVYRASPSQKAALVTSVRNLCPGRITLAIGDGANDVNMIQQAHVGVGIMGKEGNQASQFADFAICQFQDLRKLMFWHGSSFANKLFVTVICVIQKTACFGLGSLYYNIYTGFSGSQSITNLGWACFTIILTQYGWYCWFDQPVSFRDHYRDESKLSFKMSEHYKHQRDVWIKNFFGWFYFLMIITFYAAAVALFIPLFAYQQSSSSKGTGHWTDGFMNFWCSVIYCHLLFLAFFKNIHIYSFILIIFLQLNFWLVVYVQDKLKADNLYLQVTTEIMPDPLAWMVIFVCTIAMALPLVAFRAVRDLIIFPEFK